MSNTAEHKRRLPRIFLSPPFVGARERSALRRAFDSGYIAPCGPSVDRFEAALTAISGRRHAVALASGTAAIDLAMRILGVDGHWTVIAPTLTFVATVGPACHRGARPVFVDCDATGNVDMDLLDRALKTETRRRRRVLVIGVDLYGNCCDYARLTEICAAHGVPLVMDSAEAFGAKSGETAAGGAGVISVYSFDGNKTVTTSGGGALLTDDDGYAELARKLATQAREPVRHYEHRTLGYNYRLSNLCAAVGMGQLEHAREILKRKAETAAFYAKLAKRSGLRMLPAPANSNHWLNVMFCRDEAQRDELIAALEAADIESRPVWKPMHLQPVFKGAKRYGGATAEDFFRRGICLPSGAGLTAADRRRIEKAVVRTLSGRD